ncbi:hypothetical protein DICPUDRAFT_76691 [Dictyostelium purpureum]|uniref:Uncharacterized protein n=1 Tax=Dictyostelium purpureum TaxID=5786 RepID=F0ZEC3_DICPU|nr:uncharacterized protein DICPUDRAFT_76691 [Dictyostelium purpureum]EGC37693.1 hypothetical protein DICPUDRAFT_76691 [Dictyostelium purpureum]|eukprot:XP_003285797.1 hypothetical protein DICPUDRAFT_76691 [Dictyostelium purpureum]
MKEKVWYITGTSTGIGLDLIELLLNNGHRVSAITRYPDETVDELKKKNVQNLDKLLAIKTDITNDESVKESVKKTVETFGKIDVVVNNSGYGVIGAVEELTAEDIHNIYSVNVFGVYNVLRHTTPLLRNQRSGLILNISSILGSTNIGTGKYSAYESTKHAVNSITISLQLELKPFNVDVVLVCPGGIRTSFINGKNFTLPKNQIKEYDTQFLINAIKARSPNSTSSPSKVVNVLYELSNTPSDKLPKQLYLGSDAYQMIKETLDDEIKELEKNKQLTLSTNFE